jgi:chemotaxis protein CheZ
MTRGNEREGNGEKSPAGTDTELRAALSDIISTAQKTKFEALCETLQHIRVSFDPASVTMTSTNIPDASTKLAAALEESQEAAHKVFSLVEEQKALLERCDTHLSAMEQLASQPSVSPQDLLRLIKDHRSLNKTIRERAHDIVIAQESQDLVGQKIKKVLKLVHEVEAHLRSLLSYFRIEIPGSSALDDTGADDDIDQDAANQILKDFGL